MKKITLFLILLSLFFMSCEEPGRYPKYRYAIQDCVPDSNKMKMADWITKTVSASNLHMSGGDYEDPEDVIEQCEETAEKLFSVSVEGLEKREYNNDYWTFIPKFKLSKKELIKFEELKK